MMDLHAPDSSATPSFRPIPSLLAAPIADIDDVRRGDICMVGLFEDHSGATVFGARFAARQIRYASQYDACPSPAPSGVRVFDLGDLNVFPLERERNDSALIRQLKSITGKGAVPVVVGGAFGLGSLMHQSLQQETPRPALLLDLPAIDLAGPAVGDGDLVALTVDLSTLKPSTIGREQPLARLRRAIEALPPKSIGAVHLAGLAPDLDLCGRHEASLGRHVLGIVVAHLGRGDA